MDFSLKKYKLCVSVRAFPILIAFLITAGFTLFYSQYLFDKPALIGDSTKFQYLGAVGGIPHTTGYPIYSFLASFLSHLPIHTPAFRMNGFSLLCAVLTLAIFSWWIQQITRPPFLSLGLTIFLGITHSFWLYACMAEVYTFHALILILFFYGASKWMESAKECYGIGMIGLFTLGMLHHLLFITTLPGLVYLLWMKRKNVKRKLLWIASLLILILFYFGVHYWMYSRVKHNPWYMDCDIPNLSEYINFIMGAKFRSLIGFGWDGFLTLYQDLIKEWGVLFCLLFLFSVIYSCIYRSLVHGFWFLHFVSWLVICSIYHISDIQQYYLHGTIIACLWTASVWADLRSRRSANMPTWKWIRLGGACIPFLVGLPFIGVVPLELIQYRYFNPRPFADILDWVPENSIVIPLDYNQEQLLRYYCVEKGVWNKEILSIGCFPQDVKNYLTDHVPLSSRGTWIPPGKRVFAYENIGEFNRMNLGTDPLPVPAPTSLSETFRDRIGALRDGKIIAIVANHAVGNALNPRIIEEFKNLGMGLTLEPTQEYQFAALTYYHNHQLQVLRKCAYPGLSVVHVNRQDKILDWISPEEIMIWSERKGNQHLSYIRIKGRKYVPNHYGLSFVVLDGKSGKVEDQFVVNSADTPRVYPYNLYEIKASK